MEDLNTIAYLCATICGIKKTEQKNVLRLIELFDKNPEFKKPFKEFYDGAVKIAPSEMTKFCYNNKCLLGYKEKIKKIKERIYIQKGLEFMRYATEGIYEDSTNVLYITKLLNAIWLKNGKKEKDLFTNES